MKIATFLLVLKELLLGNRAKEPAYSLLISRTQEDEVCTYLGPCCVDSCPSQDLDYGTFIIITNV
jgi:hypothetical protein